MKWAALFPLFNNLSIEVVLCCYGTPISLQNLPMGDLILFTFELSVAILNISALFS